MVFQQKGPCVTIFLNIGPVFLEQCPVPQEFPEAPGKDAGFILRGLSYRTRSYWYGYDLELVTSAGSDQLPSIHNPMRVSGKASNTCTLKILYVTMVHKAKPSSH